jgi:hypothetical protein
MPHVKRIFYPIGQGAFILNKSMVKRLFMTAGSGGMSESPSVLNDLSNPLFLKSM